MDQNGPSANFLRTCKKYDRYEDIMQFIEEGSTISKSAWKHECKMEIKSHEQYIYNLECEMYKKTTLLRQSNIEPIIWWKVCLRHLDYIRACTLMVKMLVGEEPLQINVAKYSSDDNPLCKACSQNEI